MSNSNEASSDREKIAREIKQIVRHINVSLSSYKDHLYKEQALSPPEFKDHQYRIFF